MLVERSDKKYVPNLKKLAQKIAPEKVIFIPPVDPDKIIDEICAFDIGLPLLKASQKSYLHALPNKFFHYIMAGLAIIVPPLPAMAEIVNQYEIGKVSKTQSPKSVALLLNSLTTKEIRRYKQNALEAAKTFNAENEMKKLERIYINIT